MAKVEGDIYEEVAKRWFLLKGYDEKEIDEGYMGAKGIDFSFPSRGKYYEVKGHKLIKVATVKWRGKPKGVLQVTGVSLKNINIEEMTDLLIIIYDNFADRFRVFNLTKDETDSIITERGYVSFYSLFNLKNPFYMIAEVNMEERKNRACRIPFDVTYQKIVERHTQSGKTNWKAVAEDLRNVCGL
jgi:hypothetical protein